MEHLVLACTLVLTSEPGDQPDQHIGFGAVCTLPLSKHSAVDYEGLGHRTKVLTFMSLHIEDSNNFLKIYHFAGFFFNILTCTFPHFLGMYHMLPWTNSNLIVIHAIIH